MLLEAALQDQDLSTNCAGAPLKELLETLSPAAHCWMPREEAFTGGGVAHMLRRRLPGRSPGDWRRQRASVVFVRRPRGPSSTGTGAEGKLEPPAEVPPRP